MYDDIFFVMQLARAPMMIRDFPARVEDYLEWLKFPVVNSSTGVILNLIYLLLHFGGLFKRPDFWEYRPTRAIISLSSFHLIICQSDLEVIFSIWSQASARHSMHWSHPRAPWSRGPDIIVGPHGADSWDDPGSYKCILFFVFCSVVVSEYSLASSQDETRI